MIRAIGAIALAGILLAPMASQAKTLEELLVEKGVVSRSELQSAAPTGTVPGRMYWNKGSVLEFPEQAFTAKIETQLQPRYTYTDNDEESGKKDTSSFALRRARLVLSGTALSEEFYYKLQTDMVGDTGEDDAKEPELRDAFIRWTPSQLGKQAYVQMGQFKTFVSRQEYTSSAQLQFPDRTAVSTYFELDRQQGLAGTAQTANKMVIFDAGVFNGSSDGEGINRAGVDTKQTGMFRIRFNPVGTMDAYSEGDVDWTESPALSFGAVYAPMSFQDGYGYEGDVTAQTINVDGNLKVKGFSVHSEFYVASFDPDEGEDAEPLGFYVQSGYFLEPKKVELVARYGLLDCDSGKGPENCEGNDSINQASLGLNYFWWKHHLKAQLAYEFISEDPEESGADDLNRNQWMLQLTSWF